MQQERCGYLVVNSNAYLGVQIRFEMLAKTI